MNVLVTGGAGFIGSHLCDALLTRRHYVCCVDDLSTGSLRNVAHHSTNPAFRFVRAPLTALPAFDAAAIGSTEFDVVVHFASKKIPRYGGARAMLLSNVRTTETALELAREHRARFVFASTSDVYGKGSAPPFAEDAPLTLGSTSTARWGYAASKIYAEHLTFAYAAEFDLPVTILRFFAAYGPRQHLSWWGGPHGVFLRALAEGAPLEIHGDGRQTRSFIYIGDLVEAIRRVVEGESVALDGEVLNVGGTEEVSILELAQRMASVAGVSPPRLRFVPYSAFPGRYEDVPRRVPDTTKMRTLLNFAPAVSLDEGLAQLWDWFRTDSAATATS